MSAVPLAARPAHVPAARVVEFDIYRPMRPGQDFHGAWKVRSAR